MTRGRRITAARLLRLLATVEHLNAVGNDSEVARLLAGVDPIEARELANELDAENEHPAERVSPIRAGLDAFVESQRPGTVVVGFFPESRRV